MIFEELTDEQKKKVKQALKISAQLVRYHTHFLGSEIIWAMKRGVFRKHRQGND